MTSKDTILIVGAGMAGLACARTLAAAGKRIRVIESGDRVGGRLGSQLIDGMWCDLGFQVSMSNYACLESLVPRGRVERHSFIDGAVVWNGDVHVRVIDPKRSPLSVFDPIRRGLVGWRDLRGAARCRRWARSLRRGVAQSGTAMDVIRRAGFREHFIESFLRPFFGGVFLDESLCVPADRFLKTLDRFATGHAELPASSMQQLAEAMATPVRDCIEFERHVDSLDVGRGVVLADGSHLEATHVVLAVPWDVTAKLLCMESSVASAGWSGTTAVHFRTRASGSMSPLIHLNGSGAGQVNLVCSPSSVAPGYVEDGWQSVLVSLKPGDGRSSQIDLEAVRKEAGVVMGLDSSQWSHIATTFVPDALPAGDLSELKHGLPEGVSVAGDWTGDPSIEQAVLSGVEAAEGLMVGG
ncbi:MAG: hypothetical protein CMJ40_06225 [Phycisphaerae bacterium]|nr:hypothetical protein [Phycisphaerae bacterium]|tara:strand:+ start:495 stop:1727 length:1233 start_codon:yes stop_codon:yes gene_type:complete